MIMIEEGFTEKQIDTEFSRQTLHRYFVYRDEVRTYREKRAEERSGHRSGNRPAVTNHPTIGVPSKGVGGRMVKARKRTAF